MSVMTFQSHATSYLPLPVMRKLFSPVWCRKSIPEILELKNEDGKSEKPRRSVFAGVPCVSEKAENERFCVEKVRELAGAWAVYDKELRMFFVFDPARTSLQRNINGRMYLVCEDPEYGLIDVMEAGGMLLDALRKFTGAEEFPLRDMDLRYCIRSHPPTGIEYLVMDGLELAGAWMMLSDSRQTRKLYELTCTYCAAFPHLLCSEAEAFQLAKREVVGHAVRTGHGILRIAGDGMEYRDACEIDRSWQLEFPPEYCGSVIREAARNGWDDSEHWRGWLQVCLDI